jgi:hypothetical protein
MPRKAGRSALSVPMTDDELDQVHKLAKNRGYKVTADYIRNLIEMDAKGQGQSFKFKVDRGGYRGGDKKEEAD